MPRPSENQTRCRLGNQTTFHHGSILSLHPQGTVGRINLRTRKHQGSQQPFHPETDNTIQCGTHIAPFTGNRMTGTAAMGKDPPPPNRVARPFGERPEPPQLRLLLQPFRRRGQQRRIHHGLHPGLPMQPPARGTHRFPGKNRNQTLRPIQEGRPGKILLMVLQHLNRGSTPIPNPELGEPTGSPTRSRTPPHPRPGQNLIHDLGRLRIRMPIHIEKEPASGVAGQSQMGPDTSHDHCPGHQQVMSLPGTRNPHLSLRKIHVKHPGNPHHRVLRPHTRIQLHPSLQGEWAGQNKLPLHPVPVIPIQTQHRHPACLHRDPLRFRRTNRHRPDPTAERNHPGKDQHR